MRGHKKYVIAAGGQLGEIIKLADKLKGKQLDIKYADGQRKTCSPGK